jgi:hypothetical protein
MVFFVFEFVYANKKEEPERDGCLLVGGMSCWQGFGGLSGGGMCLAKNFGFVYANANERRED